LWKGASGENAVFQPRLRIPTANRYLGKAAWRLRMIEAFAEKRSIRAARVRMRESAGTVLVARITPHL
jgi:hypothetical protein